MYRHVQEQRLGMYGLPTQRRTIVLGAQRDAVYPTDFKQREPPVIRFFRVAVEG